MAESKTSSERPHVVGFRVSTNERLLIEKAAELSGWSPSKFIREAAIETALHRTNVANPKNVGFLADANRIGQFLADAFINDVRRDDIDDEISNLLEIGDVLGRSNEDLEELRQSLVRRDALVLANKMANRVESGGLEFVRQVVDRCRQHIDGADEEIIHRDDLGASADETDN